MQLCKPFLNNDLGYHQSVQGCTQYYGYNPSIHNCLLFIHSFSSLSYDRSKASSKASSPHSAIQSFLLQMRVSSPSLRSSSSFLRLLPRLPVTSLPPPYRSYNNPLQMAVTTQNATNPVSLPFTYFTQDIPLLLDSK